MNRFAIMSCAAWLLMGLGCGAASEPKVGSVTGVVRQLDQSPVYMARVSIVGGASTTTDMQGRYRLELVAGADSVTVFARDGFTPGQVYAVTHSGSARVAVRRSTVSQDIVLDHDDAI